MGKALMLLVLLLAVASAQEDDIVNTDNIPIFPKGYQGKIRAGYLSITPYTQSFYYVLCERYKPPYLARTIRRASR
jgi:hypothetical protein